MCGKVAITEQRARPTTSPIHRRAQVCNDVVVDVVVDAVVVDVVVDNVDTGTQARGPPHLSVTARAGLYRELQVTSSLLLVIGI